MPDIQQLKDTLESKYELLIFKDLARITDSPTTLLKLLDNIYQSSYSNNQKIVFYTAHQPSKELLDHIHKALALIDIGEFFFLLCCPYNIDLTNYDNKISLLTIDIANTDILDNKFYIPDTFCPLPWKHLELRHNGDISPCCVSETVLGSAFTSKFKDLLIGQSMSDLRQDFLAGIKPTACGHCWRTEEKGLESNRLWHVKHSLKEFYLKFFDDIQVRSLDIKPGNACNFKCRICNPIASSLFATEAKQIGVLMIDSDLTLKNGKWIENSDSFWNQFEELLPNIESLEIYGGEPFLIKQIATLLKYTVEHNQAKNIRLHVNSNGSIFPNDLIPLMKQFKSVDIALSIDNIEKRFELERGGKWDDIEKNILNFAKLRTDQFDVYIMPTVSILNVYYLDDIIEWAKSNNLRITFNPLHKSKWASIDYMTPAAVKLIVNKFQHSAEQFLRNISDRVISSPGSDGKAFVKQMQIFDLARSESFDLTHPEIAIAMGYKSIV